MHCAGASSSEKKRRIALLSNFGLGCGRANVQTFADFLHRKRRKGFSCFQRGFGVINLSVYPSVYAFSVYFYFQDRMFFFSSRQRKVDQVDFEWHYRRGRDQSDHRDLTKTLPNISANP